MLFLQLMKRFLHLYIISIFLVFVPLVGVGQNGNATLYGVVKDEQGKPIEMVNVALRNYPIGTTTNSKGEYLLRIPTGRTFVIGFSVLGYEVKQLEFNLNENQIQEENVTLRSKSENIGEVLVQDSKQTSGNVTRLDTRKLDVVTSAGIGTVEGMIKTMPGVTSTNELSGQYSVRGGNFDENLVYVNGQEIYRPYLVRSGNQEGLSFVNTDLVSSIEFSAGGFDAKYGDKMSSVLDIKYHRPTEFKAGFAVSLLGGKAHVEDISENEKFTFNMGIRYKTLRYLLASMEEDAVYNPNYFDYQGYFTYKLAEKLELSFLGTASSNTYSYIPHTTSSRTGMWNDQRLLTVYYEGQEEDRFQTYTGGLTLNYKPTQNAYLKFTASAFHSNEAETFDIIGYYSLNEVLDEGTEEQDDTSLNVGVGVFHEHGRNYFKATVASFTHAGGLKTENNFLQWGAEFKQEYINDRMKEWEYRDSAGYSLPYSNTQVKLYDNAQSNYSNYDNPSQRISGYFQNSHNYTSDVGEWLLTAGVRAHYWSFTKDLNISPRFSTSLKLPSSRDVVIRTAVGWYYQPAFFRELKTLSGDINFDIQTPKSVQTVLGVDYSFRGWDRPFRLTAEAYYKDMSDLIPYQVENVRVRYLADQISDGYAYGFDFKVNGEFVSGTQSWVSLSLLKTMEDIAGDHDSAGNPAGYIRRPNDQNFKFSMYFQDYLPGMPHYQMHLTGHYISGAPFGMPNRPRAEHVFKMEAYKRVDIGFMRLLASNGENMTGLQFFDRFRDASVSLEVFNVMDIQNEASYYWITDIQNNIYPMPNSLTGITFNLKVAATF